MNKKIRILTRNLQKLFDSEIIRKMALKHQFVKRKSRLTGQIFLNLCVFLRGKRLQNMGLAVKRR